RGGPDGGRGRFCHTLPELLQAVGTSRFDCADGGGGGCPGCCAHNDVLLQTYGRRCLVALLEEALWDGKAFADGWQTTSGGSADVREPATGAVLGRVGIGNAADIEAA